MRKTLIQIKKKNVVREKDIEDDEDRSEVEILKNKVRSSEDDQSKNGKDVKVEVEIQHKESEDSFLKTKCKKTEKAQRKEN